MIVIDASTVCDAFGDEALKNNILSFPKPLKAPKLLINEVVTKKAAVMEEFKISHNNFKNSWKSLLGKIVFEDPADDDQRFAKEIIEILKLDFDDLNYIALCCKYLKEEGKPQTFWTRDSKFVFGNAANMLRKTYRIFCNFNVQRSS